MKSSNQPKVTLSEKVDKAVTQDQVITGAVEDLSRKQASINLAKLQMTHHFQKHNLMKEFTANMINLQIEQLRMISQKRDLQHETTKLDLNQQILATKTFSQEKMDHSQQLDVQKQSQALKIRELQDLLANSQKELQSQQEKDNQIKIVIQKQQEEQALLEASNKENLQSIENSKRTIASSQGKTFELMQFDRYLHNKKLEVKGNIRVFARVRPILESEIDKLNSRLQMSQQFMLQNGVKSKKRLQDMKLLQSNGKPYLPTEHDTIETFGRNKIKVKIEPQQQSDKEIASNFKFDRVFGHKDGQEEVFEEVSEVVRSALDGFNVCIFAYGQTGSGKTYTMQGTNQHPGLIRRSVDMIFERMKSQPWEETQVKISCIEIHVETVRDLLSPQNEQIQLMTNLSKWNPTQIEVNGADDVQIMLEHAFKNRSIASTALNETSSRSHCIYKLQIYAKRSNDYQINGALNLIDLAGSERITDSRVEGDRRQEALAINKHLQSLGDVISALRNGNNHIPYRNSKLTHLLQSYMGGEAKTLMIVNISPLQDHAQESLTSLRFAKNVNQVRGFNRQETKESADWRLESAIGSKTRIASKERPQFQL